MAEDFNQLERVGKPTRVPAPAASTNNPPPPVVDVRKLAAAGMTSQGRSLMQAQQLSDEECRMIAITMTEDGRATAETAGACLKAVRSFHDRMKAVVDEE